MEFFNRPTLKVARGLLGKFLVHQFPRRSALNLRNSARREISAMITEVEAYIGLKDRASHASRGKTKRTEIMFGKSGRWYIYLVYGMHYCLNIVTEKENYPAAILIRSVKIGDKEIKGPGRVSKYFQINKKFNGKFADETTGLWIEDRGVKINPRDIKRGKRIGVDYAGTWKDRLWRVYLTK